MWGKISSVLGPAIKTSNILLFTETFAMICDEDGKMVSLTSHCQASKECENK